MEEYDALRLKAHRGTERVIVRGGGSMQPVVEVRWFEAGAVRMGGVGDLGIARASGSVWVDVLRPDEPVFSALAEHFPMHALAIEDCLHFPQRPKLESYGDSLFFIWVVPVGVGDEPERREVGVFLGPEWLVTAHRERLDGVEAIKAEVAGRLAMGNDWLVHAIIDRLVDDVFPVVDVIGDRLETLQDEMLADARPAHFNELYALRRQLLDLHKTVAPERDVLRGLVRERELVSEEAYRYFQDVADHLARVEDAIDVYREVASSAVDIYLSSGSNRMNRIMKQLTVVEIGRAHV